MAARIAVEKLMELRYTLRMLGVPVEFKTYLFGDNKSVVDSSNIPSFNLKKRHTAIAFHRVRECIAAKWLIYVYMNGKENPSDVLTKFSSQHERWKLIKPFLHWDDQDEANIAMGSVKLTQTEAESVPMLAKLMGLGLNGALGLKYMTQLVNLVSGSQYKNGPEHQLG